MTTGYEFWYAALADPSKVGSKELPVHEGDPQPGRYRKRKFKGGPFVAVAIWPDGENMFALCDGRPADPAELWTFVCRNPITNEAYEKAVATGQWDDEPPAIGHNSGDMPSDPHEALVVEFEQEREQADEFLKTPITTKDRADMAAVWSKRIAAIAKKATDLHRVEKQPSLDESRRIDDRWRDLKEEPKSLSTALKRAMDDYLREEDRKEQERQRKAREEAERLRREAEAAARKASESDQQSEQDREAARADAKRRAEEVEQAEREAQARNAQAGRTGAKVALREFVSGRITDFDAALMALKDRAEIQEVVQSLVNRAARSGVELPGMEIVKEKRAA